MRLINVFYSALRTNLRNLIREKTVQSVEHLTPEIKLHLITSSSDLWTARPEECPFQDPFWAFYWAGGQALSRFVLDNPSQFEGKTVVDIGSGSGACALAAKMSGASKVIANDIDPVACEAISLNAGLNKVTLEISQENLLDKLPLPVDFVLIGDMFYDPDFTVQLIRWLSLCLENGSTVLIGDPGRHSLGLIRKKHKILKIKEYPLTGDVESNGFRSATVWELIS